MQTSPAFEKKPLLLLRITCAFWLMAKMIGWKVWMVDRTYPTAPSFEFMSEIPGWVHFGFFACSIAAIAILILKPIRPVMAFLIVNELLACSLDQTRWQPWEYQYLFMILIFLVNYKEQWRIQPVLIFLLAAIYTYSGLHKMNAAFIGMVWNPMILKQFFHISPETIKLPLVHYTGYMLPLVEFAAGAALFIPRTRKIAAILLIIMHVSLLILLGPFGLNFNVIIWPWNIAMITFLYLLVFKNEPILSLKPVFYKLNYLVALFWGVMPAFCFVGLWDNYLSANLYSGKMPFLIISVKDKAGLEDLAPFFAESNPLQDSKGLIYVQSWAYKDMNVPSYPQLRTFKIIAREFMKKYPGTKVQFFTYRYPYHNSTLTEIKPE